MLDLDYKEDSSAIVDMNVVMTGAGKFVELQGTGEESPFSYEELQQLLALGTAGINGLIAAQKEALGEVVLYGQAAQQTQQSQQPQSTTAKAPTNEKSGETSNV